jgi:hypothetical protein
MAVHNIKIKWFYSSSTLKGIEHAKLEKLRAQKEKRRFAEISRNENPKGEMDVTNVELVGRRRRGFWNHKADGGEFESA